MAELFVTIPASGNAAFRWMQSPPYYDVARVNKLRFSGTKVFINSLSIK